MARGKSYIDEPVTVVFKTSERSNAKVKMKVFKNKDPKIKVIGIPDNAIYLEVGLGESFINKYKLKYKL